jgi:tripartite-type tricarboxylate transporter receptor subunit TctC
MLTHDDQGKPMKTIAVGIAVCFAVVGVGIAGAQVVAQGYPTRPVKIVVPFAPGGVADVMGRVLGQKLSDALRQQFYIDNHAGAGGNIGTGIVATAASDGYTILITSSSFVVNPSLHAKIPYDPRKDFVPVTIAAVSPNVLVVNSSYPAKSVQELVALIKKLPGDSNFASAGVGTTPHLSGELFRLSQGLEMVHVPFNGAGPALQSVVGGHTPIAFLSLPAVISLASSGTVRVLAITSSERSTVLPDVPTMAEAGYSGQEAETLLLVLVPAATPKEIVALLNHEIVKIIAQPDVKKRFETLGFTPVGMSSKDSATRINEELEKWAKVIHNAHIQER